MWEDPGRKGPERGPFSSHIARDGDWGPIFLDPAGGPKFEVTPLGLTFFSCFKKIHFTPPPHPSSKRFKFQAKMIQYVYEQDTLEVGTK